MQRSSFIGEVKKFRNYDNLSKEDAVYVFKEVRISFFLVYFLAVAELEGSASLVEVGRCEQSDPRGSKIEGHQGH